MHVAGQGIVFPTTPTRRFNEQEWSENSVIQTLNEYNAGIICGKWREFSSWSKGSQNTCALIRSNASTIGTPPEGAAAKLFNVRCPYHIDQWGIPDLPLLFPDGTYCPSHGVEVKWVESQAGTLEVRHPSPLTWQKSVLHTLFCSRLIPGGYQTKLLGGYMGTYEDMIARFTKVPTTKAPYYELTQDKLASPALVLEAVRCWKEANNVPDYSIVRYWDPGVPQDMQPADLADPPAEVLYQHKFAITTKRPVPFTWWTT
jgi:hypothetical protein